MAKKKLGIFKRKYKPPYRHIGMALIPPAAFAAVPNSPPPVPLSFQTKKIIASPIIPSILGVNALARAVGLGSAGEDLERLRIQYKSIATGRRGRREEPEVMANVVLDPEPRPAESPSTSRTVAKSRERDVYAVPYKARPRNVEEHPYASVTPLHATHPDARRKNTKFRTKSPKRVVVEALTSSGNDSPIITNRSDMDEPRLQDFSRQQHHLEERIRLHEQHTREMMLEFMKNAAADQRTRHDYVGTPPPSPSPRIIAPDSQLVKEVAGLLKEQSLGGAEGAVLKQQIQELVDENENFKDTIARLNVELSKFQEKYGVTPELESAKGSLSFVKNPNWLTEVKFLSPLFLSYDKQLEAKDDVIRRHEMQFGELSKQVEEILKENELLRKATEQTRANPIVSQQKWQNIKEQNQLMVEEIQVQLEQLELMEKKAKEMHVSHVDEVAKLSKRLAMVDAEYQQAEQGRLKLREEFHVLSDQHDRIVAESERKVDADEFARSLGQYKSEIESLKEHHLKEMKDAMHRVKESQKERSEAIMTSNELQTLNVQLQGEVEALNDKRQSLLLDIDNLRSDLDESEERELECQLHLATAVRVAEQASTERSTFAAVAEKEQLASDVAKRRSMREQWELGRMEESLKHYKLKLASHNQDISERLREVEENHAGQLMQYERKMAHLKKLLAQKQQALDEMASDKRNVENELETVWQAASSENKLMIESLSKSNIHLR